MVEYRETDFSLLDLDRLAFGTVFKENRRKKGNFAGQFRATNGL